MSSGPRPLIVLSSEVQLRAFEKEFEFKDFRVVTDNFRFTSYLESRGIVHETIDDLFLGKERWSEINAWGCNQSLEWIKLCAEIKIFKDIDLAMSVNLFLSYSLIDLVKNFCYASKILEDSDISQVVVFRFTELPRFPITLGNLALNTFLKELAQQKNLSVHEIEVSELVYRTPVVQPSTRKLLTHKVVEGLRSRLTRMYAFFNKPQADISLLAFGNLKHLSAVATLLRKERFPVALYDMKFQIKHFLFCAWRGIPYYVSHSAIHLFDQERYSKSRAAEFEEALDLASKRSLFRYKTFDFQPLVRKLIFGDLSRFLLDVSARILSYEKISTQCPRAGVLLAEDINRDGAVIAAFFKARRKAVFCVSHATLPIPFSVSESNRVFAQSAATFVQSEFEKDLYASRGWRPNNLVVTGVPRFDVLAKLKKRLRRKKMRLLYCGASFRPYTPDWPGYLGVHLTNYGNVQKPALKMLMTNLDWSRFELTVKPHNYQSNLYRNLFRECGVEDKVLLVDHQMDFAKLLKNCDMMVLAHPSTTIIEAALCGLPILFLDFQQLGNVDVYEEANICDVVRAGPEQLRAKLDELYDAFKLNRTVSEHSGNKGGYFLGKDDGLATNRVVDYIQNYFRDNYADA